MAGGAGAGGGVFAAGLRGVGGRGVVCWGRLGELWVAGVDVDWGGVLGVCGGVRVGLPSYAFQRERFWLGSGGGVGDVAAAGLSSAGHPLLGAAVGLAGGEGCVFTGRLSLESHPWLADHVVLGVVLLPGTAFLELGVACGRARLGAQWCGS